jgi:hypothetical protein
MRDIDLFVSSSTVANDLFWIERVAGERQLGEYWERVAAEGLGTAINLRREAISTLLDADILVGPFALEERFLVVRGSLGPYKIELSTGNVMLDPPGKWLSIDKRPRRSSLEALRNQMWWTEDDDDQVLLRILDLAVTLAADNRLRDKRLLDQIQSAAGTRHR